MLIMWNISDDHELAKNYAELKKLSFECSCTTKELTAKCTDSRSTTVHDSSNKFQKLEVAHFNGDIIGWRNFWSMFDATIHKQSKLTNIEKLLYLKQAVRDGPSAEAYLTLKVTMWRPSSVSRIVMTVLVLFMKHTSRISLIIQSYVMALERNSRNFMTQCART